MTPDQADNIGQSFKAMAAVLREAGDPGSARAMEHRAEQYLAGKVEEPVTLETISGQLDRLIADVAGIRAILAELLQRRTGP